MNLRTTLLFAVLGVVWGSTWLLHASPYDPVPLLCAGALRFSLAAVLLGFATLLRSLFQRTSQLQPARPVLPAAILGLLLLALPYACTAWASHLGAAPGFPAAVYAAMPLVVLLFLQQDLTPQLPTLLLGFSGISLLVMQGLQLSAAHWSGELLLVAGMLANAGALAYIVRGGPERLAAVASLRGCAIQCAVAAVALAIFAAPGGEWRELAEQANFIDLNRWLAVTAEAVISSTTLPMMYLLLRRAGAVPVAALQWLVTLVSATEAAWFLRVRPEWETWVGVVLTLTALLQMRRQLQSARQMASFPD